MKTKRDQLIKKCHDYIKTYLRAPPQQIVLRWGQKLKLSSKESREISDGLKIRAQLGKYFFFRGFSLY